MNVRCHACKSTKLKKVAAVISQGSKTINLGHGVIGGSKQGGLGGALGKTGGSIQSNLAKELARTKPYTLSIPVFFSFMTLITSIILWNKWGFLHYYTIISLVLFVLSCIWYGKLSDKQNVLLELFNNEWYCFTCGKISVTPGYMEIHKEKMAKLKKPSEHIKNFKKGMSSTTKKKSSKPKKKK